MTDRPSAAIDFSLEQPDLAVLRAMWTDLEQRADITLYLSWAWIGTWIEQAGLPDTVLIGRVDGEVVCLGLLRRAVQRRHGFVRSRTLCLHETGDIEKDAIVIEYNGFLTDKRFGFVEAEAIDYLRRNQAKTGRFDELQFGGLPEDRYEAVRASGLKTYVSAQKSSAFVDLRSLRDSGGDYLASLGSNTRYQIRRALKIYEGRGPLSLQPARSVEEALRFFDQMGDLHERAWQEKDVGGAWRFPFLVAFHKRLIETCFDTGGVEIARVSCGDTPIGYIHCLKHGGWIGSYLSGFAYEQDNKVKPGLVSFYLYIEHKIRTGGDLFDFLAGDHRYKMNMGQPGANLYWFSVQERRPQLLAESALRWVKRKAAPLLRKLRAGS